jgi:nitrite reductase/ring-hydroxylating ferredoxin subunit
VSADEIICPWHAARFDLKTGEVLSGPARGPVSTYSVRVQGDDIEVEL